MPRQEIVNNLIKPQNPNAKILESRFIFPFQPQYSDFISGSVAAKYDTVEHRQGQAAA